MFAESLFVVISTMISQRYFCLALGRGALSEFSGCRGPASRATFTTTFLRNCGSGEGLGTTSCPKTMTGGRQGHPPC